jgi:benzoyl-CoA reductase/2-hydroxyglutaryl-CoA dehydratase subunit BcrC/BadD/HgdB
MPEIVAEAVLSEVSEVHGLPVLTLFLDEHTGEAGLQTRLEAFVDLLAGRAAMG